MTDISGYSAMRAGETYKGPDAFLLELQIAAGQRLVELNAIPSFDMAQRVPLLKELLGSFGESFVVSPVTWEYGKHIHIGDGVFINFECVFLDGADVRIGDGTAIAPRVMFLTAGHPVDPIERQRRDPMTGKLNGAMCVNKPITIGKNCWIGAGTVIVGGVTIGDGTTIGAGSVVTKDIPAGVLAAGNPCRVIRPATAKAVAKAA